MAQVFISYSRKDETFAQRLAAALTERNRDVWLDREDIEFTADWKQRVLAGIEGATIFVSILSPEYATSTVCREEADHAITHNKRLVPLLRRAVDFNSLHPAISALNALPFEEADDFDAGVSKLLQAIDTDFEWLDQHTRLLQRAIEWEGKARESSLALRGNDLRAAEQWIAQAGTTQDRNPTQLQTEYILASRWASTRRLRVLLGLAIATVIITAILAIAALVQRGIAVQRTKEVSQSLSRSDFLESTRRLGADETGAALAHLARALRVDPENSVAQRRLISLLSQRNWQFPAQEPLRHDDFVWSAELSPDGKRIVTSYGAGTVQLLDLETGKPIGGPSRYPTVATATFNRDGSRIAVICELDPGEESPRGSWQILDGLTGHPLTNRIEEAGPITATAFSADSSKFLLGVQEPAGGVVRVADIASGEGPRTLLKFGAAVPAAFDAIGARVIALSQERNDADKATVARVWSLGSGKPVTAPFKHDAEIQGAIFSPDGDHIATWAWVEARIFVWNLDSDRLAFSTSPASDDLALSRVAYSPDGSLLLSTHVGHPSRESDWTIRVLDAKTGEEVRSEIRDHGRFTGAVFSPSGKYLLVASSGSRARVWPVRSGDEIEPREAVAPLEHGDVVQAALMTPDDRRIVTASFDRTLQIWQATPELGRALPAELPSAQPVFFVERSSRGSRIATIFAEPPGARIWDAATQQPLSDSLSLQEMQQGVRFSGDEKLMIARSNDGVYRVWDAGSGRLVRQLKSPSGAPIEAAVLNFDGNRAAVTDKEGTLLVDLTADRTIKLPIEAGEQSHPTLEFTPDGKRLLTLSDKRLSLWDAETGARVWGPVPSQTESTSVQFSPDGRRFAVFGADPMVTLFDSATGAFEHSLSHRGLAVDADFSDDGRLVATCSMVMKTSGYAQVWDAETGIAITQPLTAEDELHNIGISPDGGLICATERSGHVRIWSVATSRECVDPLPHDTSAFPAWFSRDGKRLLTVSGGKAQFHELWDLGGPAPSWLPDLGEAVGGFALNDNGVVVSLEDRVQILNQIRKTVTTGSGDDRHIKWARWFFEDRRARQRSPFPQTTPVEALSDKAVADATGDGPARLPATKATDAPVIHK